MDESDLNRIVKDNLISEKSWAFKIADPVGIAATMACKNPFDGFCYNENFGLTWESKLIKGGYEAFNILNQLKPHQIENLTRIRNITRTWKTKMLCQVILGIWFPRKHVELFIFTIDYINESVKKGKLSFFAKELKELSNNGKSIIVEKKIFDVRLLEEKQI
jgi:hypothetical protein